MDLTLEELNCLLIFQSSFNKRPIDFHPEIKELYFSEKLINLNTYKNYERICEKIANYALNRGLNNESGASIIFTLSCKKTE